MIAEFIFGGYEVIIHSVLNDGLVKKKITEPLQINVAVKPLGTIADIKSTQIIVQFLRW
jgi:hypothetical protein